MSTVSRRHTVAEPEGPDLTEGPDSTVSRLDQLLDEARERIAPRLSAAELMPAMARGALVVDTRCEALRRKDGELPGAVVVERNVLEWRLDPRGEHRLPEASDPDRPVVVVCDEGYASSLAAAVLLDLGRRNVTDLDGGYQAWLALQRPTAVQPAILRAARAADPAP